MANVYCERNYRFSTNEEEQKVLQKSHDIIENLRHDWFLEDDNAIDCEEYWDLENAVNILERVLGCNKVTVL